MQVLIVKTSSMGDVLHTLPALTDALQAIPDIRFDWVVEEGFSQIPHLAPGGGSRDPGGHSPLAQELVRQRHPATALRLQARAARTPLRRGDRRSGPDQKRRADHAHRQRQQTWPGLQERARTVRQLVLQRAP